MNTINESGAPTRTRRRCAGWACAAAMAAVVGIAGCTRSADRHAGYAASAPLPPAQAEHAGKHPNTLSREHAVTIDVSENDLAERFRRVADRCIADSAHHCTILESDLQTGDAPSGHIRLRIDPESVDPLLAFVSGEGKLINRSSTAEDLADAIQDTQSRLEMLSGYRKQLLELQSKAGTNIDAAIKIASELSTVQAKLEQAAGEAAYQTKRTTTEVVGINFAVPLHTAYWTPIRNSLRAFWGNFTNGLAQAITAIAYIVPWLFVLVPALYGARFLWHRRGR
jgi:Domain of unknown function (DUF4349)